MDLTERLICLGCLVVVFVCSLLGAAALLDLTGSELIFVVAVLALLTAPLAFEWRRIASDRRSYEEGRRAGLAEAERRASVEAEREERERRIRGR